MQRVGRSARPLLLMGCVIRVLRMITPEPVQAVAPADSARVWKRRGVFWLAGVLALGVLLVLVSLTFGLWSGSSSEARTPLASGVGRPSTSNSGQAGQLATVSPEVKAAEAAVVRIVAWAPSCHRRIEGSGFVYAPERVLTNAHNVAGVSGSVTVDVSEGRNFRGTVVLFDPDRDVAVLSVPGLHVPPLSFQKTTHQGDSGVLVKNAGRVGITATPAKIINKWPARGANIFREGRVDRKIYFIAGRVVPGMSGGPLLALDGTVSGVIFAAALDEVDRGYALSATEIASDALTGIKAEKTVPTPRCSK